MNLTLQEYQNKTADTAVYPGRGTLWGLLYCSLGLGEQGEIQGKIKKVLRDNEGIISEDTTNAIKGELGDLMWYVAQLAAELNISLEDVAQHNLDKLASRKERGVLQGSGDNR